ncbi:MAG TPA: 3-hydroxybutyrate dehydrogenase [Burkholderiales bacterium]|jgi:3-hydroxybutyrate dehydrogenase|nr:3-hydroxybutyrate dehydrogenase [Burkholderiales bacterium]
MELKGKIALITGSTQGIGAAFAEAMAAQGCSVVINGLGKKEDIEAQQKHLARHGVEVAYSAANMAKPDEIEQMMREAQERFGCIDILINNAVTRHIAPLEEFAVEKWDYALAVNLSAAFHTIRLVLPGMRERNWGRIINLTSMLSSRALAHKVDYVVTKHALVGLTRTVAVETAKTGITCNSISPGWVLTPHSEAQIAGQIAKTGQTREEAIAELALVRQPSRRIIDAEKIARLAVFLCSEDASEITGAALPVDGGWSAGN